MMIVIWTYVVSSLLFQLMFRFTYRLAKEELDRELAPHDPVRLCNLGSVIPIFNTASVLYMSWEFVRELYRHISRKNDL